MAEPQSIFLEKKTYVKLKKLADKNDCSVNEEVAKAITYSYQEFDPALLDEIVVLPKKDEVFVLFPEPIYNVLEENAESNVTDVADELILIFDNYLLEDDIEHSTSDDAVNVASEADEIEGKETSEDDEYSEEYGYDDEEYEEESDFDDEEGYSGEEDF